jgi:hypothetical protein
MSFEQAFPAGLADDVRAVEAILPGPDRYRGTPERGGFTVSVAGERVSIPQRVYNFEPGWFRRRRLTDRQRTVLACLYTRHHIGYVRERRLEQVIEIAEPWVVPFVVRLAGEYVVDIVETVRTHLGEKPPALYGEFVAANPAFLGTLERQVVSHWNCHHRRKYPRFADYPGTIVLDSLRAVGELMGGRPPRSTCPALRRGNACSNVASRSVDQTRGA